jgi:hypothetical protein
MSLADQLHESAFEFRHSCEVRGVLSMTTRIVTLAAASTLLGLGYLLAASGSAHALTMSECSAKYKAAQAANTLNGQKWNDFRKAECGSTASAAPAAPAPAAAAPAAAPPPVAATPRAAPRTSAPVATGNAVFPTAISAQYASQTPHLGRLHTCSDQWKANKANNTTGGMSWTVKGGGFYSECNKRLKG